MCMPVLAALKDNRKILVYMFWVGFLTISVFPLLFTILGIGWNGNMTFPMTGGYLIYTILGYLLSTKNFSRKYRYLLYALAFGGVAFRYIFTIILSNRIGQLDRLLFNYLQFHAVFLASGLFVLFKNIPWDKLFSSEKVQRVISKISACSFGIYLIHQMVMYYERAIIGFATDSFVYRVLAPMLTYAIALGIVFVAKRVPGVRKVMP